MREVDLAAIAVGDDAGLLLDRLRARQPPAAAREVDELRRAVVLPGPKSAPTTYAASIGAEAEHAGPGEQAERGSMARLRPCRTD